MSYDEIEALAKESGFDSVEIFTSYNCPCDYPLKYGCLICGNYDEYDMICLKNKNRILY